MCSTTFTQTETLAIAVNDQGSRITLFKRIISIQLSSCMGNIV
jgi:hypothetical protein